MSEKKMGSSIKKWDEVNGATSGEILEVFFHQKQMVMQYCR